RRAGRERHAEERSPEDHRPRERALRHQQRRDPSEDDEQDDPRLGELQPGARDPERPRTLERDAHDGLQARRGSRAGSTAIRNVTVTSIASSTAAVARWSGESQAGVPSSTLQIPSTTWARSSPKAIEAPARTPGSGEERAAHA